MGHRVRESKRGGAGRGRETIDWQAMAGFGVKYNGTLNHSNGDGPGKKETWAEIMAEMELRRGPGY